MTELPLKKLEKASGNSWHEIWNLNDMTTTGRNQKTLFEEEGRHGDKKSECV